MYVFRNDGNLYYNLLPPNTTKKYYTLIGEEEDIKEVKKIIDKHSEFIYYNNKDFYTSHHLKGFIFVVGGDGTILTKANKSMCMFNHNKIVRVHNRVNSLKSLGYTADITLKNLDKALVDIERNDYYLQYISLIQCWSCQEDNSYLLGSALNDISIEGKERGSNIMFKASVVLDNKEEFLPTPKCTGLIVTSYYGSPAWNLSLNGPVIVNDTDDILLLDLRESPLKPDKYVISGRSTIYIEMLTDSIINVDKELFQLSKGSKIKINFGDDSGELISFVKTKRTSESLMSKLLRFNKFQYERLL